MTHEDPEHMVDVEDDIIEITEHKNSIRFLEGYGMV